MESESQRGRRRVSPTGASRSGPDAYATENCIFCGIVEGRAPARLEHLMSDDGRLATPAGLVAFHNRLDWARVMLLIVPREHMFQAELWSGDLLSRAAAFAVELGERLCPEGFRILSNFGRAAHQSQEHAHLHVVSEADLGLPEERVPPAQWHPDESGQDVIRVSADVEGIPMSKKFSLRGSATQKSLWRDDRIPNLARAVLENARQDTPEGFRLLSNFDSPTSGRLEGGEPGLWLLGGGQLDLYV